MSNEKDSDYDIGEIKCVEREEEKGYRLVSLLIEPQVMESKSPDQLSPNHQTQSNETMAMKYDIETITCIQYYEGEQRKIMSIVGTRRYD